jgi:DNA-binding transcriptional LysR family regulator
LRLTVPPPAAEFLLAPIIAQFLKTYPEIKLDVSVEDALTDIVAERFDAGITSWRARRPRHDCATYR